MFFACWWAIEVGCFEKIQITVLFKIINHTCTHRKFCGGWQEYAVRLVVVTVTSDCYSFNSKIGFLWHCRGQKGYHYVIISRRMRKGSCLLKVVSVDTID